MNLTVLSKFCDFNELLNLRVVWGAPKFTIGVSSRVRLCGLNSVTLQLAKLYVTHTYPSTFCKNKKKIFLFKPLKSLDLRGCRSSLQCLPCLSRVDSANLFPLGQ